MVHLVVDSLRPDVAAIARAADAIRRGLIVAVPTDTLYALAADPFDHGAVDRIFAIKARDPARALLLVAGSPGQVRAWLGQLPAAGERLAARFWPGPLTLVMQAPGTLKAGVADARGTVGVRVPDHAVTRALCDAAGRPLTATSANVSGLAPTEDPVQVASLLGAQLDVLLDAGPSQGGPPSTIVDVTGETPRLIRAGAIDWETVRACLDA